MSSINWQRLAKRYPKTSTYLITISAIIMLLFRTSFCDVTYVVVSLFSCYFFDVRVYIAAAASAVTCSKRYHSGLFRKHDTFFLQRL